MVKNLCKIVIMWLFEVMILFDNVILGLINDKICYNSIGGVGGEEKMKFYVYLLFIDDEIC